MDYEIDFIFYLKIKLIQKKYCFSIFLNFIN